MLVTDRLGHLRYANPYAAALFGLPDDAGRLAGLSVLSLMCEEAIPVARQRDAGRGRADPAGAGGRRLGGHPRQPRPDGSGRRPGAGRPAAPFRWRGRRGSWSSPAGPRCAATSARRTGSGCWSGSASAWPARSSSRARCGASAEMLVPQFADHCFIELLARRRLIRRAPSNARAGRRRPGSWAQVGERSTTPTGTSAEQAMAQLDAMVVADFATGEVPGADEPGAAGPGGGRGRPRPSPPRCACAASCSA